MSVLEGNFLPQFPFFPSTLVHRGLYGWEGIQMVDLPQLRLYWFSELFKLDVAKEMAIGHWTKIEDQNNLEDC